jgi:tRNA U34 5-methylaminomethyl-2-thiouridine-forming methyltransferase MnmC
MIQLLPTSDGSSTLYNSNLDETYHSVHGALQESMHVFIENGLRLRLPEKRHVRILEIGFGTGLNALLSLRETELDSSLSIDYWGLEPFPISESIYTQLNYAQPEEQACFLAMHHVDASKTISIGSNFTFRLLNQSIHGFTSEQSFDMVFYDAFGPQTQPELWTTEALKYSVDVLSPGGIWVSYCVKGDVRRSLISLGLQAKRLSGPPGKRHMLFAQKG